MTSGLKVHFCLVIGILLMPHLLQAQQNIIRGKVVDAQGEPIMQAHISVEESSHQTISDEDGYFELAIDKDKKITLFITHISYKSLRKSVVPGKEPYHFEMKSHRYDSGVYVITATRSRRDIEDVPEPITVITEEEIKTTGSTRLTEVLAEQTGLNITANHGMGVQVQGFDSEYTKIMIDGQPLMGRTAGTLDLNRIAVGNIKQVEMIKGPSSALWGSDALAGVINIITEKGSRPFELETQARYATHEAMDLGVNAFIKSDVWQNSFFINRNSSSGYKLNPNSISQTVPPYQSYTLSYKTDWDINEAWSVNLKSRYYLENQQSKDFVGTQENPTLLDGKALQEDMALTPSVVWNSGYGQKVEISNFFSRYRTDSRYDYRKGDSLYEHTTFDQLLNKSTAQFFSAWNTEHMTTTGAGYQYESLRGERYAATPAFNSYFGFVQHEWMPTPNWDIIAGMRFDGHSAYRSQLSPKLSARYKATDWMHVRASAGSGFKAPDFRQLYLNFTNPTVGYVVLGANRVKEGITELQQNNQLSQQLVPFSQLNELKAEQSWAFNGGVELFPAENLDIRLNVFRNNVQDLIETAPVATKNNGQSVFGYFNLEKVYTRGMEAQVRWQLSKSLRVMGGYQLLDARRKFTETRTVVNDEGSLEQKKFSSFEPMFNRSAHAANLKLFYYLKPWDAEMNIRGNWYGRYGRFDQNGNGYVDENEYHDGYMIWNTAISKTFNKKYQLRVGMDNMLDFKRAADFPHYSGRTFFASLSLKFY